MLDWYSLIPEWAAINMNASVLFAMCIVTYEFVCGRTIGYQ
jgi:hypothetical protein